jgi:outer membrane protein assembly factor BamB
MATEMRRIVVAIFAVLLGIGVAFPVAAALGPQEGSPWPQFQHDPQRTGRTTVNGPVTLRQKWVRDVRRPVIGGLAIAENGTVYVPHDDYLTAMRPDGTRRWLRDVRRFRVNNALAKGGDITAPAIDQGGNIIVGVEDGRILAIESDGDLDWAFFVSSSPYADGSSPVRGPALLDSGYCCIMLGADDGEVYQVSGSGRDRGVRRARGAVTAAPALSPNSTVFWASRSRELFNGAAGAGDRWKFDLDDAAYAGPAIGPDGTAYIGTGNGTLYAIDAEGALRWKTVLSAGKKLRAAPSLGANGTVYIGSENGIFYAVDGRTGAVKWEFATNKAIEAPALVDGRDNVYVASLDGRVYVLSPAGALFSTFDTGDEIKAAMALGADGTLYVGTKERRLYALEEGDPTAAASVTSAVAAVVADVTVQRDFTSGRVYLVGAGQRRWVPDPTTAAILDIGPGTWTDVRPEQLAPIPEGQAIPALREGSLIREPSGAIYVIRNGRREWIPSPAAFAAGGFQWGAVINVPAFVAARVPAVLPEGTLVRQAGGSKIYEIEDGKRHWISTLELFVSRGFQWNQVTEADGSFLRSIPEGLPFGVAEGSIVRGNGDKVYVIENGLRRWIPTLTTFFVRGYRWESLVVLSDEALNAIPLGAPLPPS